MAMPYVYIIIITCVVPVCQYMRYSWQELEILLIPEQYGKQSFFPKRASIMHNLLVLQLIKFHLFQWLFKFNCSVQQLNQFYFIFEKYNRICHQL